MWYYVNGEFVEEAEAKISVLDRSFVYGDGCFEGIAISDGRVLHLDEHVDRLFRSTGALRIPLPTSPYEIKDLILQSAALNGMDEIQAGYIRVIVTRGIGPLGVSYSADLGPASIVIIPQVGQRRVAYHGDIEVYRAVITRYVRGGPRSVDPRVKANSYLPNILAFLEARDRGGDLGILQDEDGFVAEGHGMNIFCVKGTQLVTPHEESGLAGITRAHVIEVARDLGYECREGRLAPYDLYCADEVFVTSSLESVAAVATIDGQALPDPIPGPVATAIRDLYVQQAVETGAPVPSRSASPS